MNNLKKLLAGDKICLEPGYPCNNCLFCLRGDYNVCPKMTFHATPPVHGTFVNYLVHPAKFCFVLNDKYLFIYKLF